MIAQVSHLRTRNSGMSWRAAPQDAQARSKSLLGMRPVGEDRLTQLARCGSDVAGPCDDARRRPLGVRAMGARHVVDQSREAALQRRAAVRSDARATVQDLDDVRGEPRFDLFMHESIRHRVQVAVDEHVVVDVDASPSPVGVLEASRRQRSQRGSLDLLEERPAALAVPAQLATVQVHQELAQPRVQRTERVEHLVADARQQPPLGDLHGDLHLRLVTRVQRARRQHGRSVVLRELLVGALRLRLVPTRARHADFS